MAGIIRTRIRKIIIPCKQVRRFSVSKIKYEEVRVRFAPSPTGLLHLGGLRTALYNYLFAKSQNGKFILRLEDTDQSRLVPDAINTLEEMLIWANIPPDESPKLGGFAGPYIQSQRLQYYQKYIQVLLDSGAAYKCFCSAKLQNDTIRLNENLKYDNRCRCRNLSDAKIEKLEREGRPSCIRFKLKPTNEPLQDLIYGPVLYNVAGVEGDPVIFKSDGFPTYHLANVIDDHLMGITHVIRGNEWLTSTPKHILLYGALGWKPPKFGHLPLILNQDGSKMSKRQKDCYVDYYRANGYSPLVLLNYLSIGGGFKDRDHNILYSLGDLVQKFNLALINTYNSRLDPLKLHNFNRQHFEQSIKTPALLPGLAAELYNELKTKYGTSLSEGVCEEYVRHVLVWSESRVTNLQELLCPEFSYLWMLPDHTFLQNMTSQGVSYVSVLESMQELFENNPDTFRKDMIVICLKSLGKTYGLKVPAIMKLVRGTICGIKKGPPVGEMLALLGREEVLRRISHALTIMCKHQT